MPITRFQLRNEYGLGTTELYWDSVEKEDPKAVLDGVAVAGLVGVLRQLGDLADFAADVFHTLQEQVMITSSRSRKLMSRVKNVEAALPPLEKAILTQTSHIHFAYTPGSEWHARVVSQQNHFIYSDLPRCIMDPYEECKEPPCLQLLDRFSTSGPGSCLKKYSDPTFFRRASGNFSLNAEKSQKERKSRKIKEKKSTNQGSHNFHDSSSIGFSSRVQFSPPSRHHQSSPTQTVSTFDMTFKSDVVDLSDSLGSGDRLGFIECVFHPTTSTKLNEEKSVQSPSVSNEKIICKNEGDHAAIVEDNRSRSSISGKSAPSPSSVTWDEKIEISDPVVLKTEVHSLHQTENREFEYSENDMERIIKHSVNNEVSRVPDDIFEHNEFQKEHIDWDFDRDQVQRMHDTKFEVHHGSLEPRDQSLWINDVNETNNDSALEPNADCIDTGIQLSDQIPMINDADELDRGDFQLSKVEPALLESDDELGETLDGNVKPISYIGEDQHDENESETDNFVDALNTIESESESDLECQTKKETASFSNLTGNLKGDMVHEQTKSVSNSLGEFESPSTTPDNMDKAWLMALEEPTQVSAVDLSLECSPSCNAFDRELCQNSKDLSFSMSSVVDMALQGPTTCLSLLSWEEPVREAVSPSHFSRELWQKPNRSISCVNEGNNTGLEVKLSSLQNHPYRNDFGVMANHVNVSELESSIGQSESTATSTLTPVDCVVQPQSVSHQPHYGPCAILPSTLWTNGCLLGLQPSKPMDLGTSNATRSNGISYDTVNNENQEMLSVGGSSSQCSFSAMGTALENVKLHQSHIHSPLTNAIPKKTKDSVESYPTPNEILHVDENRFPLPGFGGGLVSRLRKTRSIGYDELPKAVDPQKSQDPKNGHEDQLHHSLYASNPDEEMSSITSPPSSPALEHVRISFQPISSLETSKLKLKYPDGIDQHGESVDAYPSFQLVPEPANLHHGVGSDSDDDTFCRSNPCVSEDELSHLSDSNSELWESGDTSEIGGHRGYNGLHRISSEESISCPSELAAEANIIPSDDSGSFQTSSKIRGPSSSLGPLPNMAVLCNVNPLHQEAKIRPDPKESAGSFSLRELTPQPPPLPPLQWRISRSQFALTEGDVGILNNNFSFSTDSVNPVPAYDQQKYGPSEHDQQQKSAPLQVDYQQKSVPGKVDGQQKSAPAKFPNKPEGLPVKIKSMFRDGQMLKFNAQEKASQATKSKEVDEREDFLQQIRTKSFNLRKTGIPRAGYSPPPPSMHVQVTAILEKAKTVRRAVASDGEDGWSDP